MNRVLLVDDDALLTELLTEYLSAEGLEVSSVPDGEAGVSEILSGNYNVVVLDSMMPKLSGLDVLKTVRQQSKIPIIMLTAKGEDVDRIVGLEVGADDYLGKPFNPRELLARIHAVLRRRPPLEAPGAPAAESESVSFGPFVFDLSARSLHKNGAEISLTTGEFAMLKALVRHPRQPLSREKLAQLARGREFEPFDRSLDVQISRLRKLIEQDPASPRYIQTVWGVGYVFVPDGAS